MQGCRQMRRCESGRPGTIPWPQSPIGSAACRCAPAGRFGHLVGPCARLSSHPRGAGELTMSMAADSLPSGKTLIEMREARQIIASGTAGSLAMPYTLSRRRIHAQRAVE
jgi:hypothetical protein